jgi:hypothetical protein
MTIPPAASEPMPAADIPPMDAPIPALVAVLLTMAPAMAPVEVPVPAADDHGTVKGSDGINNFTTVTTAPAVVPIAAGITRPVELTIKTNTTVADIYLKYSKS